jgi:hypothetical protein
MRRNPQGYAKTGTRATAGSTLHRRPCWPTSTTSSRSSWLKRADEALYRAKDDGRNCCRLAESPETFRAIRP